MPSNAGMANRQRDVVLSFAQVSALSTLAWLGLKKTVSGAERGESCFEARRPLAMRLFPQASSCLLEILRYILL
jgi:hypothetical protein